MCCACRQGQPCVFVAPGHSPRKPSRLLLSFVFVSYFLLLFPLVQIHLLCAKNLVFEVLRVLSIPVPTHLPACLCMHGH